VLATRVAPAIRPPSHAQQRYKTTFHSLSNGSRPRQTGPVAVADGTGQNPTSTCARPLELSTLRIAATSAAEDKMYAELPIPSSQLFLPSSSFLLALRRVETNLSSPTAPFFFPTSVSPEYTPPSPPGPSPATSGGKIDSLRGIDGTSARACLQLFGGGRRRKRGGGGVRSGCWATRIRAQAAKA
jgi:hypothetical protein